MKAYNVQLSTAAGNPLADLTNAFGSPTTIRIAETALDALNAALADMPFNEQERLESVSCTLLGEVVGP